MTFNKEEVLDYLMTRYEEDKLIFLWLQDQLNTPWLWAIQGADYESDRHEANQEDILRGNSDEVFKTALRYSKARLGIPNVALLKYQSKCFTHKGWDIYRVIWRWGVSKPKEKAYQILLYPILPNTKFMNQDR